MTGGPGCPDREQLRQLVASLLDPVESARFRAHLAGCDSCQAIVTEMGTFDSEAVSQKPFEQSNQENTHSMEALIPELDQVPPIADPVQVPSTPIERAYPSAQPISNTLTKEQQLGQYRIIAKIGAGGMGDVYRAVHTKLDKQVALKILPDRSLRRQPDVERFAREMKAIGRLDHPNIVRATDAGEAEGVHYLAMELVDGIDLSEVSQACGPLPIADACELIRQAAEGLHYAHEHGRIHRDVKPSNLMLTPTGQVKVLDLGLALLADADDELTVIGSAMGTVNYMAPEQASDSHHVDHRADIYSLGCTLYRLLTGKAPYSSQEDMSLQRESLPDNLSAELASLVTQMLAVNPATRPQSAAEVAERLTHFVADADLRRLFQSSQSAEDPHGDRTHERVSTEVFLNSPMTDTKATATTRSTRRKETPPIAVAMMVVGALLAIVLGFASGPTVYRFATDQGLLVVEVDESLDTEVEIKVAGADLTINSASGWRIGLKAQQYDLEIAGSDDQFKLSQRTVTVTRGGKVVVQVERLPPPRGEPVTDTASTAKFQRPQQSLSDSATQADGWIPLFDGKTLEGWTSVPELADWQVEDGAIVGRGESSLLFYTKEEFDDFELKFECQTGDGSNSGVFVRSSLEASQDKNGYEIQIDNSRGPQFTGSLYDLVPFNESLVSDGSWFTISAIGMGNRLEVRVNGQVTALYEDRENRSRNGYIALQQHFKIGNVVRFRNIELRRLPRPTTPSPARAMVKLGSWQPGPTNNVLPGLIPRPAKLPGIRRWQIETVACRGPIAALALSPDGTHLAAGALSDGYVRVYDTKTGHLIDLVEGRPAPLSWSPTGGRLAMVGPTRDQVEIWSIVDHKKALSIATSARDLDWSPDGRRLVVASRGVTIWDTSSAKLVNSFGSGWVPVSSVDWSLDGSQIATLNNDAAQIWNADNGELAATFSVKTAPRPEANPGLERRWPTVAFGPAGHRVLIAARDDLIRVWRPGQTDPELVLRGHGGHVTSAVWTQDGKRIVSGGSDGAIRVWDAESGAQRTEIQQTFRVQAVTTDRGFGKIASTGWDGAIRFLDLETGSQTLLSGPDFSDSSMNWSHVAWSPNPDRFATVSTDRRLRIWDAGAARVEQAIDRVLPRGDTSLEWNPDGQQLLFVAQGQELRSWDARTGKVRQLGERLNPRALAWAPDGQTLAVGTENLIRQYNTGAQQVRILEGHSSNVLALAWSPDGQWLASSSDDKSVRLWSGRDGVQGPSIQVDSDPITIVSWTPDSRYLWLVTKTKVKYEISRWDTVSGQQALTREMVQPYWSPIAFSPDSQRFIGHSGGDVGLYESTDSALIASLSGHTAGVRAFAWHPLGQQVVTGSDDGTLRVWSTTDATLLWFAVLLPSGQTAEFSASGEMLNESSALDRELVYLVERPEGRVELLTPSEFRENWAAGGANGIPE